MTDLERHHQLMEDTPEMIASEIIEQEDFMVRLEVMIRTMDHHDLATAMRGEKKNEVAAPIIYRMGLVQDVIKNVMSGGSIGDKFMYEYLDIRSYRPGDKLFKDVFAMNLTEDELAEFPMLWSKSLYHSLISRAAPFIMGSDAWKEVYQEVISHYRKNKIVGGVMKS